MLALITEVAVKESDVEGGVKFSYELNANCKVLQDAETGEDQPSTPSEDAVLRKLVQRFAEVAAELMGPPSKAWSRIRDEESPNEPIHDMDRLVSAREVMPEPRTFREFPKQKKCPVCGTNKNGTCVLIPIDGTYKDNKSQAEAVHLSCAIPKQLAWTKIGNGKGILYTIIDANRTDEETGGN